MDTDLEVTPQQILDYIALIKDYHDENKKLQNKLIQNEREFQRKINLYKLMSIIMIFIVSICLIHQTYHEEYKDIKSMTESSKQLNENLNTCLSDLNVQKILNNDLEINCKYNENEYKQCKHQNTSLNENLNTCLNDLNAQKDLYNALENSFKLNENKWNQYKEESTSPKEPTSNIHNNLLKLWLFALWLFVICFIKLQLPQPRTNNVIDSICVNYITFLCVLTNNFSIICVILLFFLLNP